VRLVGRELTEENIGAAYAVHNEFGFGFLEKVYENALAIELKSRKIAFRIWKKCDRAARVQNTQKIILKILLILSYWNIATSVQTKSHSVQPEIYRDTSGTT